MYILTRYYYNYYSNYPRESITSRRSLAAFTANPFFWQVLLSYACLYLNCYHIWSFNCLQAHPVNSFIYPAKSDLRISVSPLLRAYFLSIEKAFIKLFLSRPCIDKSGFSKSFESPKELSLAGLIPHQEP